MTHPLIADLARDLASADATPDMEWYEERARGILLALLRNPAMREPSADAAYAMRHLDGLHQWRAGCDALAREVESSR